MRNTIELTKTSVEWLGLIALLAFATVGTAFAETKDFAIGVGTGQPQSHYRTFTVPCGTSLSAQVTFSRSPNSAAGAGNDVPILIELRKPGATAGQEGPISGLVVDVKATRTPQTKQILDSSTGGANLQHSSSGGCSIPWLVRVKHDAAGPAPIAVTGKITVNMNTSGESAVAITSTDFTLAKHASKTIDFGPLTGFGQGRVSIAANWNHSIFGVQGPNPVKLTVELLNPNGVVVATAVGYSSVETNELLVDQRFRLTYQVADCVPGQWKLRFNNGTNDDTQNIKPRASFAFRCL